MRNPRVSYDVDVNTTTCDCCGGEVYDDNICKYQPEREEEGLPKSLCICETCAEELPEDMADGDWSHIKAEKWATLVEHCKRSRVLNFIPASEQINDENDVREFFAALTRYLVWHPETKFLDYEDKDGAPLFLEGGDHLKLDLCMERAFEVCEKITKREVDPYEIGFEEMAKADAGIAAATGRDHKTGKLIEQTPTVVIARQLKHVAGQLRVQQLETCRHGYDDWNTYAIRSSANICLAVVGEVDRASSEENTAIAKLFAAAPELLAACKYVEERLADAVDWGVLDQSPFYPSWIKVKEAIARAEKEGV